jgi:hypothetical protein
MRHFALALVLACMLSGTVSAGEIPSTGVVTPPTPSTVTVAGEVPTTGAPGSQELTTVLTIFLTLLSTVR